MNINPQLKVNLQKVKPVIKIPKQLPQKKTIYIRIEEEGKGKYIDIRI